MASIPTTDIKTKLTDLIVALEDIWEVSIGKTDIAEVELQFRTWLQEARKMAQALGQQEALDKVLVVPQGDLINQSSINIRETIEKYHSFFSGGLQELENAPKAIPITIL